VICSATSWVNPLVAHRSNFVCASKLAQKLTYRPSRRNARASLHLLGRPNASPLAAVQDGHPQRDPRWRAGAEGRSGLSAARCAPQDHWRALGEGFVHQPQIGPVAHQMNETLFFLFFVTEVLQQCRHTNERACPVDRRGPSEAPWRTPGQ
jgi:hypothetical protein